MTNEPLTIDNLITNTEIFSKDPNLAKAAKGIFEFTQFLLDDDENLTKTGNLNSKAKELLQKRTLELLGVSEETTENKEVSND